MPAENEKTVIMAEPSAAMQDTDEGREIDLVELFFRLLENLKYIIIALIVGAVAAGLITKFLITPKYESTAKLYVLNSSDSVLNLSDLQIGNYLASDYQEVFKTWEVNEQVITNLNLEYTYTELQDMLTITNPSDTRIIYITIQSDDPNEAALIANEYATVARKYISTVMVTEMPSVLSDALANPKPVSPSYAVNILIGGLLGMLIVIAIVTLRFIFDDGVKSTEDIVKLTGMPVLAVVPVTGEDNSKLEGRSKKEKLK